MEITIDTDNCTFESNYTIEESATSSITISIEYPVIISVQSRKALIKELKAAMQAELSKFEWLIVGSVTVDFAWYLNAVERQETDKAGDIDNITKPVLDSLIGPGGILVDDSQIGGLYTFWMSKNLERENNFLRIEVKFNNDSTIFKKNLFFLQYYRAICFPFNIDPENIKHDLIVAKFLMRARRRYRRLAGSVKAMGYDIDHYFVCSEYDFHRTRVNAFPSDKILDMEAFGNVCAQAGLGFADLFRFFREKRKPSE